MSAKIRICECRWCGTTFQTDNPLYVYCSHECYTAAHREQCRINYRRRYAQKHEQECERRQQYYAEHAKQEYARVKQWYANNLERKRAYAREYYHKHKKVKNNDTRRTDDC